MKFFSQVLARVLYVNLSTGHVGLSLRRHLLPPDGAVLDVVLSERVSEVVQGCKMSALHHRSGALMKMPDETTVFVHVSTEPVLTQMYTNDRWSESLMEFYLHFTCRKTSWVRHMMNWTQTACWTSLSTLWES